MSYPLSSSFKWKSYPAGRLRSQLNLPAMPFGGIWLSECGLDLFTKLLRCDPKQRISASDALQVSVSVYLRVWALCCYYMLMRM